MIDRIPEVDPRRILAGRGAMMPAQPPAALGQLRSSSDYRRLDQRKTDQAQQQHRPEAPHGFHCTRTAKFFQTICRFSRLSLVIDVQHAYSERKHPL
jgi:hypothetical protein